MNTSKSLLSIGITAIAAYQLSPILPSNLTWLVDAFEVALLCRISAIGGREGALNSLFGNCEEYFEALFGEPKPLDPKLAIAIGHLKDGFFEHIFPDGQVPLYSNSPSIFEGRESYVIDPDCLTRVQVVQLINVLQKQSHSSYMGSCMRYEDASMVVLLGCPINTIYFTSVSA